MPRCPVCGEPNSACVPPGYVPIPDAMVTDVPMNADRPRTTAVPKAADKSRAPTVNKAVTRRAVADKQGARTADKSADSGEEKEDE